MTTNGKSIKNQLKTIGRFPKFLVLLGASSLVLPVFSYAATAATVQPSARLDEGVQALAVARSAPPTGRLEVTFDTLSTKLGVNGVLHTSSRYSATITSSSRHHRSPTTTSTVTRTVSAATPTTSVATSPSTTVAGVSTPTTVAPAASTTVAPTTVAPTTSTSASPTTTVTVNPTTTTTKVNPTTTTTKVNPTTTTTKVNPTTTTTVKVNPTTTTTVAPTTTTTVSGLPYPIGTVSAAEPSGYAPPSANALANYSQSYVTDFSGTSIPSGWNVFTGNPGGDPGAQWGAAHVSVANGLLSLNTYQDPSYNNEWVTGGLCQCGVSNTYGAYFVRSRVTGAGPTNVELLWPAANVWPPEIDFNETGGGTSGTSATVHWSTTSNSNNQDQRTTSADMTQWHTWGVIWTPTSITYTLDGKVWGTVTSTGEIPTIPMTLDLTQQTWCSSGFACPTANQSMQIDWVAEYTAG